MGAPHWPRLLLLVGAALLAALVEGKGKDLYDLLNVPRNADEGVIKRSYRKLALKYHPVSGHTGCCWAWGSALAGVRARMHACSARAAIGPSGHRRTPRTTSSTAYCWRL